MEKLQNGDYCENLTKEQFDELIEIEGHWIKLTYENKKGETQVSGIGFKDDYFVHLLKDRTSFFIYSTKLSFEDFKNRAINTFKK